MAKKTDSLKTITTTHSMRQKLICLRAAQYYFKRIKKTKKGYMESGTHRVHFGNVVDYVITKSYMIDYLDFDTAESLAEKYLTEYLPHCSNISEERFCYSIHYAAVVASLHYHFFVKQQPCEVQAMQYPLVDGIKTPIFIGKTDSGSKVYDWGIIDQIVRMTSDDKELVIGDLKCLAKTISANPNDWNLIEDDENSELKDAKMKHYFDQHDQLKTYVLLYNMKHNTDVSLVFYDHTNKDKFIKPFKYDVESTEEEISERLDLVLKRDNSMIDYIQNLELFTEKKGKMKVTVIDSLMKYITREYNDSPELVIMSFPEYVAFVRKKFKESMDPEKVGVIGIFRYYYRYDLEIIKGQINNIIAYAEIFEFVSKVIKSKKNKLLPTTIPKDHYSCIGCDYSRLCSENKLDITEKDTDYYISSRQSDIIQDNDLKLAFIRKD